MSEITYPRIEVSYLLRNDEQKYARLFSEAARRYVESRPEEESAELRVSEAVSTDVVTHINIGRSVLHAASYGEIGHEADLMHEEIDGTIDDLMRHPGFAQQYHGGQDLRGNLPEQELA